ncbi:MAG: DUF2318 domain-containing protein [Ignavibacteriales bacterium]|nr:DUF2318 domain-containing protein [Ignavibacteriales bacterium]
MNTNCSRCGTALQREVKYCPNCGTEVENVQSAQLPSGASKVTKPMSRKAKLIYLLCGSGLFIVLIAAFGHYLPGGPHPVITNQPEVSLPSPYLGQKFEPFLLTESDIEIKNGFIKFNFNLLRDKKFIQIVYHNVTSDEVILAYISPAGKLVTAIGLCEPCGSKTFSTDETEMVSSCGTKWNLDNLEFSGGCGVCQKYPPDPIPSSIEGSEVRIDESIVKKWKRRVS